MQTLNQTRAAAKNASKKLRMQNMGVTGFGPFPGDPVNSDQDGKQGFALEILHGKQWTQVAKTQILDRARDHSAHAEKLAHENPGTEYRVRRTDGARAVLKFCVKK